MQDSPSTPRTPDSPNDITVSGGGTGSAASGLEVKPNSPTVTTPLTGAWRVFKPRNKTPTTLFEPSSCEAAKDFLSSKVRLPPRPHSRTNPLDTPKTSRVHQPGTSQGKMICHGCHLQMGQGAHQGSAAGKNVCTLPHSINCPGGIHEDDSYRACPTGYVYHGQVVPESGFLNTMNQSDFMSSTPASASSTPGQVQLYNAPRSTPNNQLNLVPTEVPVIQPASLSQPMLVQATTGSVQSSPFVSTSRPSTTPYLVPSSSAVTMASMSQPGLVLAPVNTLPSQNPSTISLTTSGQSQVVGQVPNSDNNQLVYDMLRLSLQQMGEGARPKTSQVQTTLSQHIPVMTLDVQAQVDALRAANQVQRGTVSAPSNLNIADIRADPALQNIVGTQLQYIRGGIPALSSARSAPAPVAEPTLPPPTQAAVPVIQETPVQYQRIVHHQHQGQVGALNPPPLPSQTLQGYQGQGQGLSPAQGHQTSVQGVQDFLHLQQQQLLQLSQPHHDYQAAQEQHYRLEYRCSPTSGRTYQIAVPVQPTPSAAVSRPVQVQYEWRCDPLTGATFKVPVQRTPVIDLNSPNQNQQLVDVLGTNPQHGVQVAQAQALGHSHPYEAAHYQQPQSVNLKIQAVPPQVHPQGVQQLLPQQAFARQVTCPNPQQLIQQDLYSQPAQITGQNPTQGPQHLQSQPGIIPGQQSHAAFWNPNQSLNQNLDQLHQQSSSFIQGGVGQIVQQAPPHDQDRLKGIVPLNQGEVTSKTRVIDFAKKCPVKWAKTAKADSINLPLYSYGAVTEIEAALSGRGTPMQGEVLLAKIRHLKNVFEVCCLNSTPSDFSTYGWQIARDYAIKVEEEVEQNFVSWQDMVPGVRTQTLVLSQMEYPRQQVKKKVPESENLKAGKKERCITFNNCTTEGKCDYEVANPGRTCNRKHECSWCRNNLQQSYKHQAWKCLKRQAADQ